MVTHRSGERNECQPNPQPSFSAYGTAATSCGATAFPTADVPDPDLLAAEIVDDLQAALEQFREIVEELGE